MPAQAGVRLEGLRELQTAFRKYNRDMHKDFREAFLTAGRPVAQDAESLSHSSLSRIRPPWSSMRVGFSRNTVWVAPVARGSRGEKNARRKAASRKFADRLLDQAMVPAVNRNIDRVERELNDALVDLGKAWARV